MASCFASRQATISYFPDWIVEAAERAFATSDDAAGASRRVQAELPRVDPIDVMIAGRLRQARIHLTDGDWAAVTACAAQLASDLSGLEVLEPSEAWALLYPLDQPLIPKLPRLIDR